MESEEVIKIKENPTFTIDSYRPVHHNVVEEGTNDKNENTTDINCTILLDDEDIPLIDSEPSYEDIPVIVEDIKERPIKIVRPQNIQFKPSVLDSPDIFNLTAPLVSCENILTPAISKEATVYN